MSTSTTSTASGTETTPALVCADGTSSRFADFWAPDSADRRPLARLAALLACLALLGGVTLVLVHPGLNPLHLARVPLIVIAWAAFAAAAWPLRPVTGRLASGLILRGGLALPVA